MKTLPVRSVVLASLLGLASVASAQTAIFNTSATSGSFGDAGTVHTYTMTLHPTEVRAVGEFVAVTVKVSPIPPRKVLKINLRCTSGIAFQAPTLVELNGDTASFKIRCTQVTKAGHCELYATAPRLKQDQWRTTTTLTPKLRVTPATRIKLDTKVPVPTVTPGTLPTIVAPTH